MIQRFHSPQTSSPFCNPCPLTSASEWLLSLNWKTVPYPRSIPAVLTPPQWACLNPWILHLLLLLLVVFHCQLPHRRQYTKLIWFSQQVCEAEVRYHIILIGTIKKLRLGKLSEICNTVINAFSWIVNLGLFPSLSHSHPNLWYPTRYHLQKEEKKGSYYLVI